MRCATIERLWHKTGKLLNPGRFRQWGTCCLRRTDWWWDSP